MNGKEDIIFNNFVKKLDSKLSLIETNIAIIFYALMIIIVLIGVFLRFVLRVPNQYGEEVSMLLMFGSTCMGISIGIRARAHLGVEGFRNALPKLLKKIVCIFSDIVVMIVYFALGYLTFTLFKQSFEHGATTAALQLPYFIIYFIMAVNFALCLIQSLIMFYNDYIVKVPILDEKGGGMIE